MFQVFYTVVIMVVVGTAVVWTMDLGSELTRVVAETARQANTVEANVEESSSEPASVEAASLAYGEELVISAGPGGHFIADAEVNGQELQFLVDTGASVVMLTPRDAELLGFDLYGEDYSLVFETPNGPLRGAPVILDDVQIGPIVLSDVHATIAESPSPISLLGMSFLGRLDGYEVRNGTLVLHW